MSRGSDEYKRLNKEFKKAVRVQQSEAWNTLTRTKFIGTREMWRTFKISRGEQPIRSHYEPEALRDVFADVHHIPDDDKNDFLIPPETERYCFPDADLISIHELDSMIKSRSKNSSPGPDKVTFRVLQSMSQSTKTWIVSLFNACLRHGHFPQAWKMSQTCPLPKPGGGWRPISLLPIIGKLLELAIYRRIKDSFDLKQLHNFAVHGGTQEALKQFFSFVGGHRSSYVTFFDIRKAFDKVNQRRLTEHRQRSRPCRGLLRSVL